ncbi:glycyl-tRNA synthetase beta subunit domain protein [Helicobacter pylori Hp H-24b]|nr:glycyl-tRNA synthetase beta subunit domain protein [Helicobacter pylori Hp H-24b]
MHSDELLVEVLVEELPAQALLNEYKEMPKKLHALSKMRFRSGKYRGFLHP